MTPEMEEWRPISGHEDMYEVSNLGRVRSLDRVVTDQRGIPRRLPGKSLRPRPVPTGYLRVGLGRREEAYIHRLVLEAFIGPCPDGMEACHGDSDRTNNKLSNLRWDTRLGNCQDIVARGSHANSQKPTCPQGHEYDGLENGWKSEMTGAAQEARLPSLPESKTA